MSDLDHEVREDEEIELHLEFFACTQEKRLKNVPPMASEYSSLVGGVEVDMRVIESIHRISAECLADDNPRVNSSEEICTVIDEVPCIVEKRDCLLSRVEEESFQNKKKFKSKNSGSVCPASVCSGTWQSKYSQKNWIGEIFRKVERSDKPGDLKGKQPNLCAVINLLVDPKVREINLVEETSTWAVVYFESSRGRVQIFWGADCQD